MPYMFVAVTAGKVGRQMSSCQDAMNPGPLSTGGRCNCPALIMSVYGVTLAELTYMMAQKQPLEWATPGKFCGGAALNCTEPKCIPLPR